MRKDDLVGLVLAGALVGTVIFSPKIKTDALFRINYDVPLKKEEVEPKKDLRVELRDYDLYGKNYQHY